MSRYFNIVLAMVVYYSGTKGVDTSPEFGQWHSLWSMLWCVGFVLMVRNLTKD